MLADLLSGYPVAMDVAGLAVAVIPTGGELMERIDKEALAREIVLFYFQSFGQGLQKRIDTLNKAVAAAGINALFVQNDNEAGWSTTTEGEADRAKDFRRRLDLCWPIASFEEEQRAVETLLAQYKNGMYEIKVEL